MTETEWTNGQLEKMDLQDTGITGNQLSWLLYKVTKFIEGGGGTFGRFVEELGSDYAHVYCCGGMNFTNALCVATTPSEEMKALEEASWGGNL